MDTSLDPSRGRAVRVGAACSAAAVALLWIVPMAASASPGDDHKVTICHRTNSVTNPYTENTVDVSSVDGSLGSGSNDHTHHLGPTFDFTVDPDLAYPPPHSDDEWGDIIPPYTWGAGPATSFPGKNWDALGQAIHAAGCVAPQATTPTTAGGGTTTTTAGGGTTTTTAGGGTTTTTAGETTTTTGGTTTTTAAVLGIVITPSGPPADPPGTQVLGIQVSRSALALSGLTTLGLAALGAGLVALGLAMRVGARAQVPPVVPVAPRHMAR